MVIYMIMNIKQRKTKIKPRIKLNNNIYNVYCLYIQILFAHVILFDLLTACVLSFPGVLHGPCTD